MKTADKAFGIPSVSSGLLLLFCLCAGCSLGEGVKSTGSKFSGPYKDLKDNACLNMLGYAEQYLNPRYPDRVPQRTAKADIVGIPYLEVAASSPLITPSIYKEVHGTTHEIRSFFILGEGNGRGIRFFFHPDEESRKLVEFVKQQLQLMGCSADVIGEGEWPGMVTASRSVLVQHPETGYVVSMSLPLVEGNRHILAGQQRHDNIFSATVKLQNSAVLRYLSAYIALETESDSLWHEMSLVALEELANANLAIVTRELPESLVRCDDSHQVSFVPGFALHSPRSRSDGSIALPKGNEAGDKWKALFKSRSQLIARLFLAFGYNQMSPHGQNMLVEITKKKTDTKWSLTGQWAIRDVDTNVYHSKLMPKVLEDFVTTQDEFSPQPVRSEFGGEVRALAAPDGADRTEVNLGFFFGRRRTAEENEIAAALAAQPQLLVDEINRILDTDFSRQDTPNDGESVPPLPSSSDIWWTVPDLDGDIPAGVSLTFARKDNSTNLLDDIARCLWGSVYGDIWPSYCPEGIKAMRRSAGARATSESR